MKSQRNLRSQKTQTEKPKMTEQSGTRQLLRQSPFAYPLREDGEGTMPGP